MTRPKRKREPREFEPVKTVSEPTPEPPAPEPPGRVVAEPVTITLELPMLRLTGVDGQARLPTRHLDIMFRTSEVQVLCDLCDGLRAAGQGKPRGTHKDALRWMLAELIRAFEEGRDHDEARRIL